MLAFRYIALHYLKSFFVILGALILFFVGFEYMDIANKVGLSANLQLIYLVYKSFHAIETLLPLSLIFAMIATKILLIRSNYLVALYALGYTKFDVIKPFIVVATVVILFFISLYSFSSFSRSGEHAQNIKDYYGYHSMTRDLFFTHEKKYVYFSRMIPLQKKAYDIRVFTIDNNSLNNVVVAKEATYIDDAWYINEADILVKPKDISFSSPGISIAKENNLKILNGFKPKILDQIYEGKVDFSIGDAIDSLQILNKEGVDNSNIRSALYKIFIYPFFVPMMVIIIFFFVPISVRFLNVSVFSFLAILSTLVMWSILYTLIELANNKTISPEVGIILPIVVLSLVAIRQLRTYR